MGSTVGNRSRARRRGAIFAAVNIVVVLFAASAALMSFRSEPEPGHSGERRCTDFDPTWSELEVDPVDDGNGTYSDGTLTVTVDFNRDTQLLDWTSNIGVDAVWMKGSVDAGSLYTYDPEATSGTDLHTPPKPGTDHYWSLNHALFCYDVETSPPSPTATPTPSPSVSPTASTSPTPSVSPTETASPTPTPTPSPSVLPTETETASPSPSPSPSATVLPTSTERAASPSPAKVLGEKIGRTGADVRTWMLAGSILLGLGIASFVIVERTRRNNG